MKKIFLLSLSLITSVAVYGASISFTVPANTTSNLNASLIPSGPIRVTQVIASSDGTHSAAAILVDNPSGVLTNYVPAYTNLTLLYTNYVSLYTNYFGVTNYFTNIAQVTITNSVSAVTNPAPVRYSLLVPTNSSVSSSGNYFFYQGLTITNGGNGTGTYTITYQQ